VLALGFRRERRRLPLGPLAAFLITLWSWTIYSSADPLVRYMIPALHSVQYLYFVALLRVNEARAEEGPPRFGRPVGARLGLLCCSALALGWFLLRGLPTLCDEAFTTRASRASMLGPTPFFAAFYAVVNIHHYFMDYAIWRRDNPDTRYLHGAPPA
jgi:hypothetical protein